MTLIDTDYKKADLLEVAKLIGAACFKQKCYGFIQEMHSTMAKAYTKAADAAEADQGQYDDYWRHAVRLFMADPIPEDWREQLENLGNEREHTFVVANLFESFDANWLYVHIELEADALRGTFDLKK